MEEVFIGFNFKKSRIKKRNQDISFLRNKFSNGENG